MSLATDTSSRESRLTKLAALTAAIAAIVGVFIQPTISPSDVYNELLHKDSIKIEDPTPRAKVEHITNTIGTASKAGGHDLFVLVRPPDELGKYYIATPEPVIINSAGRWEVKEIRIGSENSKERERESGDIYQIIALIVDREGIFEIAEALRLPGDAPFLPRLPKHVKEHNVEVELAG